MRTLIPVEETFKRWEKNPKFVAEHEALEEEFALASALIKARGDADMTQEQVGQAVVARLESGKTMPSLHGDAGAVCEGYWDEAADSV